MNAERVDRPRSLRSRHVARDRARWLVAPLMGVAFATYVAMHSPLRDLVARMVVGRSPQLSYFAALQRVSFAAPTDAVVAAIAISVALVAAACVTRRFDGAPFERPLVFALSAFAFIVVPAAAVGGIAALTGTSLLQPPLGPALVAAPSVVVAVWGFARGWRPAWPRIRLQRRAVAVIIVGALAAGLVGLSAIISLTRPPTGFDALAYHAPMAVYLWRDGNLVDFLDRAPGGFALAMPGAAELWFGLLVIAGGERLANLGQLPFAIVAGCAVHAFARRLRLPPGAAILAGAAFLLAPMVVVQAGMQLNDVVAAALLMSAVALACVPAGDWSAFRLGMVGLALGLAVTTKLAVLPGVAAVGLFVVVAMRRAAGVTGPRLRAPIALAVMFAAAVAPWWIRNAARYGNPIYPAAIPLVGRGLVVGDFERKDARFVPAPAAWPLYPIVETHNEQSGFGPLFLVGALPGLAAAVWRRRRRPLLLYGWVAAVTLPAWWLLTQHEPRHLLVVFALGFAFLPLSLVIISRRFRPAAVVLLVLAATFSALVTLDQALLPRAREPMDRAEFYERLWGVDSAVAAHPEREPILYNTGYAVFSYAGDYPLLGSSLGRALLVVDGDVSTEQIVTLMRRANVRHAYVPASPDARSIVEAKYSPRFFELERVSTSASGDTAGTRRYLFRLRTVSAEPDAAAGDQERGLE